MVAREQQERQTSSEIKKRYTLEEFHAFEELPENAGRLFELIDGEIVEKVGSFIPSKIAMRLGIEIGIHLKSNPIGYLTGADGTYNLSEDNEFIPDVGYISKERLPQQPKREVLVAPDLAIEVKSPTDRFRAMRRKAERYLELGTKIVWLVFPESKTVEVYSASEEDVQIFKIGDTLEGGDVLPGFTLAVKDIFEE